MMSDNLLQTLSCANDLPPRKRHSILAMVGICFALSEWAFVVASDTLFRFRTVDESIYVLTIFGTLLGAVISIFAFFGRRRKYWLAVLALILNLLAIMPSFMGWVMRFHMDT